MLSSVDLPQPLGPSRHELSVVHGEVEAVDGDDRLAAVVGLKHLPDPGDLELVTHRR